MAQWLASHKKGEDQSWDLQSPLRWTWWLSSNPSPQRPERETAALASWSRCSYQALVQLRDHVWGEYGDQPRKAVINLSPSPTPKHTANPHLHIKMSRVITHVKPWLTLKFYLKDSSGWFSSDKIFNLPEQIQSLICLLVFSNALSIFLDILNLSGSKTVLQADSRVPFPYRLPSSCIKFINFLPHH